MAEEITITVCDFHANIHEQLQQGAGDQYTERIRDEVEQTIHDCYREAQRRQEQRQQQQQGQDAAALKQMIAQQAQGATPEGVGSPDPDDVVDENQSADDLTEPDADD